MNLILLSGGLDSALCLHLYGAKLAVGFDYGQPHKIELTYAERLAGHYRVPYRTVSLPFMPKVNDVVFAGRNAVMLAAAVAMAQTEGLQNIIIGCNFSDNERFPDCRNEFIKNMDAAFHTAYGVHVCAPLLMHTKSMVVAKALEVNLRIENTWSCYKPHGATPCGKCAACNVRAKALTPETATEEGWSK